MEKSSIHAWIIAILLLILANIIKVLFRLPLVWSIIVSLCIGLVTGFMIAPLKRYIEKKIK